MTPTPERFRRLARSSPWRWDGVTADLTWWLHPARLTIDRPDRLRAVGADGRVLQDGTQEPTRRGPRPVPSFDDDGLCTTRRRADLEDDSVPMWQTYLVVAALDPAELADGVDGVAAVDVLSVRAVLHAGREAWEARVRPTEAYAPLCGCCAVLPSAVSDRAEGLPPRGYADEHLVRLDVETGICVRSREVGGPRDGQGHDLRLLDVRPGHAQPRVVP